MRLTATNAGTYWQIETLEAPRYAPLFDRVLRPEALATALTPEDCLFVPCRTPPQRMIPVREAVAPHLAGGGTVVAMGESRSDLWLPVEFHERPTNWWWWREPGADLGNRIVATDHPLLTGISVADVTWHLHGHLDPPEGAEVLVTDRDGLCLLYVDAVTTPGTIVATTLDPIYHHGSHFMPATTRFLDRFLPNLRNWCDG